MPIKRSTFNLSGLHLTTYKMGQFIPVTYRNIYPGDSVFARSSHFVRLLGLNTPVIHPVYLRAYWFWCPLDIVWPNWKDYISGADYENPAVLPTIDAQTASVAGSIYDKMGMSISAAAGTKITAFLARAYNQCWNWYIRDEVLDDEIQISTDDGVDSTTPSNVLNVRWEKDDYTVARPWTQQGSSVYLPLGTTAPVIGNGNNMILTSGNSEYSFTQNAMVNTQGSFAMNVATNGVEKLPHSATSTYKDVSNLLGLSTNPDHSGVYTDLSAASQVTVPELRFASAMQREEESRAVWGNRYPEYLQRDFGVSPYPTEFEAPVYLGGGRRTIQFSEVLGTVNNDTTKIGDYGGHASGLMSSKPIRFFAREHGILLLCVAMQPGTIYNQGFPRDLLKSDRTDWIQPEFVGVGMQDVLTQEIYAGAAPGTVFGYNERYYYERHANNTSGGDFRTTLNTWTMTRDFSTEPTLNSDFVKSNPTERIFAANTYDQVVSATYAYIKVRRVLPKKAPYVLK